MNRWSRYTTFAVTMLMVLALCAMQVVPVLADDGAPPPTETPEVVPPPTENAEPEAAPTEPPAPEATPVVTEVPAELQAPAPAEAAPSAAEEAAAEPETPAEVLAQVPAGTEVVVLDKNGKALPLASVEAAEAVELGDPVWCPVGVNPGGAGCTPIGLYTTLSELVAGFVPTGNGVIWIESGNDLGTAVTINGSGTWAAAKGFSLTLKGGWNGAVGGTINPLAPSVFDTAINITNWNGDITLSDIVFSGVTTGTALTVTTTKNITMTNVKVGKATGHNTGAGAVLNNSTGTGNITLTNSEFSYNDGGDGLNVVSNGTITLNTIDANSNGGNGAVLNNVGATTAKNVVLTNSIFSDNAAHGVVVLSRGAITASNLVANSNATGWGASLNNQAATTALGVTLTGSSQFKFNGSGLQILSDGNITLNNITATNNTSGMGTELDNDTSSAGSTVTLTGTNAFNLNGGTGLSISSLGIILLNNLTANNNAGFGADLNNSNAGIAKTVTLNGVNSFSQNGGGGLQINSTGAVTLNKVTASNNAGGRGVYVDNGYLGRSAPQNVTMIGYGTFNSNGGTGLTIYSYGTLALANLTANSNGGSGAVLNNYLLDATTPKAVTLTGNNTFSANNGTGLEIISLGAITINNVIADLNGGSGASLDNSMLGAVGGITVGNTATYWPSFSNNGNSGIQAYSRGNIILKDFSANGNGGTGVYLENTYSAASNVTVGTTRLNWRNYMDDNVYSGMEIFTNGTVMLSNLYAYGNGRDDGLGNFYGFGLYVDNSTAAPATPKNVTLLGYNTFNNNYSGGVYIYTDGAILANNLRADNNRAGTGAYFDNNASAAVPQNVTLNGYGDFSDNVGMGIYVSTFGAITLNNIYADNNVDDGIYLDNYTGATQVRGVTINGYVETYNNGIPGSGAFGLAVFSRGAITLANLDAWNNDTGVYLDNYTNAAGSPVNPVTVTGHTWADSSNTGYGLYIETLGAITLANLEAAYNATFGAYLRNDFTGSVGAITITGYADAYNNYGGDGLLVYTNRAITIARLYAANNQNAGAILNNTSSGNASPQNVTLSGYNSFYGNGDTGLVVSTYGAITLDNVSASGNGGNLGLFGWGAYLDNGCVDLGSGCTVTQVKGITLNGTNNFNNNYQDGLYANSLGIIKANSVTASWNSGGGAVLNNQYEAGYYGVTLTGSNTFEYNGDDGLALWSNGAVTINNLTANNNGDDGAYIDAYSETAPGGKVTLTGNNTFINNGNDVAGTGSGLIVYSDSMITINNLTANQNTEEGAYLYARNGPDLATDSWTWSAPVIIKLTGVNTFNENGGTGLYFYSPTNFTSGTGAVDISKLTADNNGGSGVYGYIKGNITITCGSMTNNGSFGWSLTSGGVINLKGVFSYGNVVNTYTGGGTFVYARTCPLP